MSVDVDVAVVGAGPYGLSIASHLRARGIEHRIFGTPMQTWRSEMPQGMFLKSEGFASDLFDPSRAFRLGAYCAEQRLPYAEIGLPVSREVFADYGVAFQRKLVPGLEPVDVDWVAPAERGFRLTLANGETLQARRVVLAIGIRHFARMPAELADLPPSLAAHSSRHPDLGVFAGREMLVLGAGASALDCAALLVKAGASVQLVARAPKILFHEGPTGARRPLMQRLRAPMSGLGAGWKSRLCTDAPQLFHAMPEGFRVRIANRYLGPAPGWWTRPMVEGAMAEGRMTFHLGQTMLRAAEQAGRVAVTVAGADGSGRTLVADHLIAATGYYPDTRRLGFLSPALRLGLRTAGDAPVLSRSFESSIPGLYFVGLAAANSFGPMLRFAYGAGFAARTLARHLRGAPAPRRGAAGFAAAKALELQDG